MPTGMAHAANCTAHGQQPTLTTELPPHDPFPHFWIVLSPQHVASGI